MITAATTRIVSAIRANVKLPPEVLRIVEDYYGIHPRDVITHNIRLSRVLLSIKDMGEYVECIPVRESSIIASMKDYTDELKEGTYDALEDKVIYTDYMFYDYIDEMTKRKQHKTKWGKMDLLRNRIASVVRQINEHTAPTQAWVMDYLENQLTELKVELAAI